MAGACGRRRRGGATGAVVAGGAGRSAAPVGAPAPVVPAWCRRAVVPAVPVVPVVPVVPAVPWCPTAGGRAGGRGPGRVAAVAEGVGRRRARASAASPRAPTRSAAAMKLASVRRVDVARARSTLRSAGEERDRRRDPASPSPSRRRAARCADRRWSWATLARSCSLRLCSAVPRSIDAAHAGAQLQHLDLHRDDAGQQYAEDRDPVAPADDPVEQPVIG